MKRLVFCFDGTWNKLDAQYPTNVVLTAESVVPTARDGTAQFIHYDEGVGTTKWDRVIGGAFGYGLTRNLAEAYRFLIFNYMPGDEIYIFGFSRGAYSARSFAGLLRNSGIIERCHAGRINEAIENYRSRLSDESYKRDMLHFRRDTSPAVSVSKEELEWRSKNIRGFDASRQTLLKVKYLGVWDTVGALGIPDSFKLFAFLNERYQFHDTALSEMVESARHAVAIDEHRREFAPTLWSNLDTLNEARGFARDAEHAPYRQCWFPGTHSSVGGGGERRGLSDEALSWVLDGARQSGLDLDISPSSRVYSLKPDYTEFLESSSHPGLFYKLMKRWRAKPREPGPQDMTDASLSAKRRWLSPGSSLKDGKDYRPVTLQYLGPIIEQLDRNEYVLSPEDDFETKEEFELYEVQPGDQLGKLAKRFYDSAREAGRIFRANRHQLTSMDRIFVGQLLRIPKGHRPMPHNAADDPLAQRLAEEIAKQE